MAEQDLDAVMGLFAELRPNGDYVEALTGTIQAVLMSPEFLYRPVFGFEDPSIPTG